MHIRLLSSSLSNVLPSLNTLMSRYCHFFKRPFPPGIEQGKIESQPDRLGVHFAHRRPPRRPRDRLTYLPRPLPRPGARPGPMPAMLAARRATSRPAFRADARSPPADTGPGAASISRLTRWPVKRAPAKDVRMHVRHGLARLRAGVED